MRGPAQHTAQASVVHGSRKKPMAAIQKLWKAAAIRSVNNQTTRMAKRGENQASTAIRHMVGSSAPVWGVARGAIPLVTATRS